MKNYVKIFILAIVLFGLTDTRAAKRIDVTVSESQSVVNITLAGVSIGESLVVKSFKGSSLIYKKVFDRVMDFSHVVSLKGVKNGVYFVEVENNDRIDITPVLKNDLGVTLIDKAVKTFIKPQFKNENGVVTFTVNNPDANAVAITIVSDAFVIFKEEDIKDLKIDRTFDTNRLKSGSYNIVVKMGSKTFSKEFNVF